MFSHAEPQAQPRRSIQLRAFERVHGLKVGTVEPEMMQAIVLLHRLRYQWFCLKSALVGGSRRRTFRLFDWTPPADCPSFCSLPEGFGWLRHFARGALQPKPIDHKRREPPNPR